MSGPSMWLSIRRQRQQGPAADGLPLLSPMKRIGYDLFHQHLLLTKKSWCQNLRPTAPDKARRRFLSCIVLKFPLAALKILSWYFGGDDAGPPNAEE